MPPKYSHSNSVRQETHDTIGTRFAGGHADELDSSSTSLDIDSGKPKLKLDNSKIKMFHGNDEMYELQELSDIQSDDRVLKTEGHVTLSSSVKKVYKAYAKALDEKLFRLDGTYDCANNYILDGMSEEEFQALPRVEANQFYPYRLSSSSQIKGSVKYHAAPATEEGQEPRTVTFVNVGGNLKLIDDDRLNHGDIIYLGGDHGENSLPIASGSSDQRQKGASRVGTPETMILSGPGAFDSPFIITASPFQDTWGCWQHALNIGLAKLWNCHFIYWGTDVQPGPGKQLCELPLETIPNTFYRREGS